MAVPVLSAQRHRGSGVNRKPDPQRKRLAGRDSHSLSEHGCWSSEAIMGWLGIAPMQESTADERLLVSGMDFRPTILARLMVNFSGLCCSYGLRQSVPLV